MKTHFITVDNAWPALKERGMAGILPAVEMYPVHGFASDLHYTLLANGVLTCLFQAPSVTGMNVDRILEGLPVSSGLQIYSHHIPGGEDSQFLALSSLVPYRYPFSPLQGFGALVKSHSLGQEMERLELSTRETYETLLRCVNGESGALRLLSNPTPLLQILGPIRINEASLECSDSITYNLSYLLLGPSRLALLVEFNAFSVPGQGVVPHPAHDLEYLAATCIHQPKAQDLTRLDSEVEDYLTFLNFFRKAGPTREVGFPSPDFHGGEQSVTLKGKVLAKHYVLLFGSTLVDLRLRAQDYIRDLCRMGISFHASMIRTRENYCHLYPGNYRLLSDGIRIEASKVPSVLKALHP